MYNLKQHLILKEAPIKDALNKLNTLAADSILFITDNDNKLIGSLTDGDVRRGLLSGLSIDDNVEKFIQPNPRYILKSKYCINDIIELRKLNFRIIPILDDNHRIVNILNFRFLRSYLPVDAIIMAGGRGQRLRPLTDNIPKPLLKVGEKPIIEHNIDHLASYGVDDIWISVKYLGEQIENHLKDGTDKNIHINYIWESTSMGTIGAASKIKNLTHDYVLVINSDILTNLDYEDFYLDCIKSNSDLSVITIPYLVDVPYAVLETNGKLIIDFKEKPTYTYYSNGGIYLMKKECLSFIPENEFYNATDLMQKLIEQGKKVTSYPLRSYWLDIGRNEDYRKAQEDINHIKF